MRRKLNAVRSRGVAMLLVLVSLMMATILTAAYVATRDNSATIGENAVNSGSARWTADSGVDAGVAILQTRSNWRTAHDQGTLVRDYPLLGGTLNITVIDTETSQPPNDQTENVVLTAHGMVDGVEQSASVVAYVPVDESVDVDLSEFAVFATDEIDLTDDAIITRWPRAPQSALGRPIALGTQATGPFSISIDDQATVIDGRAFYPEAASSSLMSIANDTVLRGMPLPDAIPAPASPDCGEPLAEGGLLDGILNPIVKLIGGTTPIVANTRGSLIEFTAGALRTLTGDINMISDGDMLIKDSKVVINGNAKIIVFGRLRLDKGAIELKNGATLSLYVGDRLEVRDSYIGNQRANNLIDTTGAATWTDPDRILIFRLPGATDVVDWVLEGRSAVKGSVYTPRANFSITEQSALYGRVMAKQITMSLQGALFYDHGLDGRFGYTTRSSPLYAADGRVKTNFSSLASLDASALEAVAQATGCDVDSATELGVVFRPNETPTAPADVPALPTPRPIEITHRLASYGSDILEWETADAATGP